MVHSWFISSEDFHKKKETKILNWLDLSTETVYNITKISVRETPAFVDGISYILSLEDREANRLRVWGSRRLVHEIIDKRGKDERVYLISLGQERYQKNKTINNYDLTFEKTGAPIKILDDEAKHKISQANNLQKV